MSFDNDATFKELFEALKRLELEINTAKKHKDIILYFRLQDEYDLTRQDFDDYLEHKLTAPEWIEKEVQHV